MAFHVKRDSVLTDAEKIAELEAEVERLSDELQEADLKIADVCNERDEAIRWNHSVAVCRNHTKEITKGECLVCRAERAEAVAREAIKMLDHYATRVHGHHIVQVQEFLASEDVKAIGGG